MIRYGAISNAVPCLDEAINQSKVTIRFERQIAIINLQVRRIAVVPSVTMICVAVCASRMCSNNLAPGMARTNFLVNVTITRSRKCVRWSEALVNDKSSTT